jgi:hypothetical protein
MLVLSALLAVEGCAAAGDRGYGAQKRKVELRTTPGNYEVFVVPNQDWLKRREILLANGGEKLAEYSKGTAPATVSLLPYEWVLVARDDHGTIRQKAFVPTPNSTVTIDFSTGGMVGKP